MPAVLPPVLLLWLAAAIRDATAAARAMTSWLLSLL
jgi:hypothetical protein